MRTDDPKTPMVGGRYQFVMGGCFIILGILNFTTHHPLVGVGFVVSGSLACLIAWTQHRDKAAHAQRSELDPD